MMSSLLWVLTISVTLFLNAQAEASQGPGHTQMDPKLGAQVAGPFDMTCTFLGRSKKVVIVYRRLSKEIWEPKQSCNDGAGIESSHHVAPGKGDPRLMITGWYNDGQGWKQCDLKGWKDDPKGKSLSCQTPSGGTMTVTCTKGRCAQP
jgi:hypothetical protein